MRGRGYRTQSSLRYALLSEQNFIEELVDVVECTLLIGTVFSGRRAGSI